jgi:hypothetical protein
MQSQLKEAIDARDHLERDYRAKQAQVRKGRSYIEQLKKAVSHLHSCERGCRNGR